MLDPAPGAQDQQDAHEGLLPDIFDQRAGAQPRAQLQKEQIAEIRRKVLLHSGVALR